MKRFGSVFPFLEQGPRHAHMGRLVANAGFVRALLAHASFDEFLFGSPSRTNLLEFEAAVRRWVPPDRAGAVRCADYATWRTLLGAEPFHVLHLGGWGHFMPGLHYLRSQLAPRAWPITGIIHSLHGRETIDHAVRLASAGMLPCDAVFCTSRDGARAMSHLLDGASEIVGRRFRGRLVHAPLGVPDDLLEQQGDRGRARERLRIPGDAVVALVLGRMSVTQKLDPAPLCRVFARTVIPAAGPRAFLVFAGGATPAEVETLRQTVDRHGLGANVRVQANFPAEQKRDVLAMADVLVAPVDNTQETFGLSLLEAGAAGLPVVASRFDGYKDLVRDGVDGFLVDTWRAPVDPLDDWFDLMDATVAQLVDAQGTVVDPDALGDRLVRLLTDEGLRRRMGEAGREKVARDYRWSRVIAGYEALWNDLAERAAGVTMPAHLRNPFALGPSAVFGHYTSGTLDGGVILAATATHLDEMPFRDTAGWLAQPILERTLELATPHVAAGELVQRLGLPAGQAWFAIAWLMKYGLLRGRPGGPPQGTTRPADSSP